MSTNELDQAWAQLSDLQRTAAEWGEGPMLVLAGPGSGKTRVLTCHIARMLDATRGENFRVLGLTFTNKAADEMRARVVRLVPGEEGRLFLGTFHSFCSEILRQHGSHLGIRPTFNIYSQTSDLEAILSDAVEKAKGESSVVSDLDKKTLPVIQRLKSFLVFPDQCKDVFDDPEFGERMAVVYPEYEAQLGEHNALDFASLILRAYELFDRFPAFAKRYRTVYPYICVDEFQDTNDAQYNLLKALMGDSYNNVFVVADDDQIIYQWNGASHKRLEELATDFSPTVVQLPVNYRCPAEIVELANNLIRHNLLRTEQKQPLVSHLGSMGQGTVRVLPVLEDDTQEAAGVAEDIKIHHFEDLESVAVLGRNRRLLVGVETALRATGIQAVIAQRKDEFESAPLVWMHSILKLANDRQNRQVLEAVCGTFKQLTGVDIDDSEVTAHADASDQALFRRWIKHAESATLDAATSAIITNASRQLGGGSEFLGFCDSVLEWCDGVSQNQAGQAKNASEESFALYSEERQVWAELVREIVGTLGRDVSLEAFLQELEMRSKESMPGPSMVRLYTIHGSKGKEFDHVYLVGLVEDILPSFQSIKKGDRSPEMEEERRNCFVAITRTSRSLTLSYAKTYRGWRVTVHCAKKLGKGGRL